MRNSRVSGQRETVPSCWPLPCAAEKAEAQGPAPGHAGCGTWHRKAPWASSASAPQGKRRACQLGAQRRTGVDPAHEFPPGPAAGIRGGAGEQQHLPTACPGARARCSWKDARPLPGWLGMIHAGRLGHATCELRQGGAWVRGAHHGVPSDPVKGGCMHKSWMGWKGPGASSPRCFGRCSEGTTPPAGPILTSLSRSANLIGTRGRAFSLCLPLVPVGLLTLTGGQPPPCHLAVSSSPTSAPGTERVL